METPAEAVWIRDCADNNSNASRFITIGIRLAIFGLEQNKNLLHYWAAHSMHINLELIDSKPEKVADRVISHPNPPEVSLSLRASALVFSDPQSLALLSLIERVADSNATALIIGESGTGKELIARRLHELGPRSRGRFAAINAVHFLNLS